jgi:hypothetical protein
MRHDRAGSPPKEKARSGSLRVLSFPAGVEEALLAITKAYFISKKSSFFRDKGKIKSIFPKINPLLCEL